MLTIKAVANLIVYWLSALFPRDSHLAVFGAWDGDRYCDNPKYLMLYLLEHSDIKCVWIGKEKVRAELPQHPRLRFAVKGSWLSFWLLVRARFWFFCHYVGDVSNVYLDNGAVLVNLWHGIPLKYMGAKTPYALAHPDIRHGLRALRHAIFSKLKPTDIIWTVSSSPMMSKIMVESFPWFFAYERILEYGTPRNDFLIKHASDTSLILQLKEKYCELLGIPRGKKIILYLPTWRMTDDAVFSFYGLSSDKQVELSEMLAENDAVLVEKHHHATLSRHPVCASSSPWLKVVSSELHDRIDPQELYLISDMLITDYSSAFFDYAVLKRPCLHFMYDYERYRDYDSGFACDIKAVAAGPCVFRFDELFGEINRLIRNPEFKPASGLQKMLEFETGECSRQILAFMNRH